jgi:hypothetical protein
MSQPAPTTTAPRRKIALYWDQVQTAVEVRHPRARKQHECVCCDRPIEVGERYLFVVWAAPWTLIADDVDEDGRPCGSPSGQWDTSKVHSSCVRESDR